MPVPRAHALGVYVLTLPYLHDIPSLLALLQLSHPIRSAVQEALTPHTLLTLLSRTHTLSSELASPLGLLPLIAPGLERWLVRSPRNRRRYIRAVRRGATGLVELALRYPAITNASANATAPLGSVPIIDSNGSGSGSGNGHPSASSSTGPSARPAAEGSHSRLTPSSSSPTAPLSPPSPPSPPSLSTPTARPFRPQPLSLAALSQTSISRLETLNALTDLVDKCVGAQWYATPDFWDGGAEDAATVFAEPGEVIQRWVGYGEMFGRGVEGWLGELLCQQERRGRGLVRAKLSPSGEGDVGKGTRGQRHGDGLSLVDRDAADIDADDVVVLDVADEVDAADADEADWRLPAHLRAYEVPLRCEYVKYVLPDWHTRLERYKGYEERNGIWSEYPYPASLADSEGEDDSADEVAGRQGSGVERGRSEGEDPAESHDGHEDRNREELDHGNRIHDHHDTDEHHSDDGGNDGNGANDYGDTDIDTTDTTDTQPTFSPTVHPLRATLPLGPYHPSAPPNSLKAGSSPYESEHVSVLLHLFERSPLFRRIAAGIRYRAIQSAQAQDDSLPLSDAQQQAQRVQPAIRAILRAREGPAESGDLRDWKQVFWEDALWTSGWDGLELLFDAWERDPRNDKARMRRARRTGEQRGHMVDHESTGSEQSSSTPQVAIGDIELNSAIHTVHTGDGDEARPSQIPDGHPALQRLARIYTLLSRLDTEPKRVEFESIDRPQRSKVCTWLGPVLLGDLRAMYWSNVMGQSWEMR